MSQSTPPTKLRMTLSPSRWMPLSTTCLAPFATSASIMRAASASEMSVPHQSSPMGSPKMMAASVRFGVRMSAPAASSAIASHSSGV